MFKKNVKKKKKPEKVQAPAVSYELPANYRESVISASKLTAGIAGAALVVPLKLTLNEKKISLSSFVCSVRYEKTENGGFRAGIFPSDMTVRDAQTLARALVGFYKAHRGAPQ